MARYWFCTARSNLDSWRFNQGRGIVRSWPLTLSIAGGSWEQYIGQRYELVALRALCAGERPRARWAGGLGKELFLRSLFAPDLPKELFRKVLSFWAPVWD